MRRSIFDELAINDPKPNADPRHDRYGEPLARRVGMGVMSIMTRLSDEKHDPSQLSVGSHDAIKRQSEAYKKDADILGGTVIAAAVAVGTFLALNKLGVPMMSPRQIISEVVRI